MKINENLKDKIIELLTVADKIAQEENFKARGNIRNSLNHIIFLFNEPEQGQKPILKRTTSIYHESHVDGTGAFKSEDIEAFRCPQCDWFVGEYYAPMCHAQGKKNYCDRCGQRIDWSDWNYEYEKQLAIKEGKRDQEGRPIKFRFEDFK